MLIARFLTPPAQTLPESEARWGLVEGGAVTILQYPPYEGIFKGSDTLPLSEVKLLPPATPSKIVAIGWNYLGHIKELNNPIPEEPLIFLKAPSSMIGDGDTILLPPESERVDYEGELAVVIGRKCRRINRSAVAEVILGYTALNDVTARDLQRKDGQFSRAKSFDTFCPVGPWVQTELEPAAVQVQTRVNGELRQDDNTSTMLFDPHYLVEYVSTFMTLLPGDIIATGTPSGVGPLKAGDEVTTSIDGIGSLTSLVGGEEK